LWDIPNQILESVRDYKYTVAKSCHASAKTHACACALIWFLYTFPQSKVISSAPTNKQLRYSLWAEVAKIHRKAGLPGKLLQQSITIDDAWFAIGFTTQDDQPDKFQSQHAEGGILVILDEAGAMPQPIFDEGLASITTGAFVRVLLPGQPTQSSGEFYDYFQDDSPDVKTFTISAFDTPNFTHFGITEEDIADGSWKDKVGDNELPRSYLINPSWVEERHRKWGPKSPLYVSRVLGKFPKAGPSTLISLEWIEEAQKRDLPPDPAISPNLGVDPARYGDDSSVISKAHEDQFRVLESYQSNDLVFLAGEVKRFATEESAAAAYIDTIGVGAGVYDILDSESVSEEGLPFYPEEVKASHKAHDTLQFGNRRAELYWNLRERFREGRIDIDPYDKELAKQLGSLKYRYDAQGRIFIESKEEMKKRGLDSPDLADSAKIAFSDDVAGEVMW